MRTSGMFVRFVFCIRFVSRAFDCLRHVAIVSDDKRIANTSFLRARKVRNCKLVLTRASPTWLLNLGKPRRTGVSTATAWQGRWQCRRINRVVTLKRARSLALRSCVPSWFAAPREPLTDHGFVGERTRKQNARQKEKKRQVQSCESYVTLKIAKRFIIRCVGTQMWLARPCLKTVTNNNAILRK